MAVMAALDIGYSNVKIAWMHSTSMRDYRRALLAYSQPADQEDESPALHTRVFPACAVEKHNMASALGMGPMPGHTVTVDGAEWQALISPEDAQNVQRDHSDRYVLTPIWQALWKGALVEIDEDVVDTLVLGLPSRQFYDADTPLVETMKESIVGTHEIAGRSIEVKNVQVVPQPLGTFNGHLLSSDKDQVELLMDSVVLVIDPGFFSTDTVLIGEGRRIYQDSSGSSVHAVSQICDRVAKRLVSEMGVRTTPQRIEKRIREGNRTVRLPSGKAYDFSTELAEESKDVAYAALNEIRARIFKAAEVPNIVIVTGGGAEFFYPHVADNLDGIDPEAVHLVEDSVEKNVLGYLRLACDQ